MCLEIECAGYKGYTCRDTTLCHGVLHGTGNGCTGQINFRACQRRALQLVHKYIQYDPTSHAQVMLHALVYFVYV